MHEFIFNHKPFLAHCHIKESSTIFFILLFFMLDLNGVVVLMVNQLNKLPYVKNVDVVR